MLVRVVVGLAVVLALADRAEARPKPPCKGCVLEGPATTSRDVRVPLLVVLHGDRERAKPAAARWRAAARASGWALLALACPADEQCAESWWRWNGDPAYVHAQVDRAIEVLADDGVAIDASRLVLAGWSGGGTYLGLRAQAWAARFAGVVIHGGGMAPMEPEACPAKALPAYFLVGDRNPLHALAVELRAHFERCGHAIVWDLQRGAAHDGEHRALTVKKARAILAWLHERPRT